MRKLIMAVLVVVPCLTMSGCFTFDEEHNETIVHAMLTDIRLIHQDLDFMLAMDEESQLDSYYR